MFNPIFLVGPTCVSKSSVSIQLAKDIHAEIVSCDSMQVYRGMDIGTAKPSKEEQIEVSHYMIDCVDISQEYNVSLYVQDANKIISEIQSRNKTPIIVGGTGMYVRALIDGLFEGLSGDEKVRNELDKRAETEGLDSLYEELKKVDSISFLKIKSKDKKRIIRALEVYYVTGKPISSFQTQWKKKKDVCIIGLNRDRKNLYERINSRVDKMFEDGLIEEVKGLMQKGLVENKTARQALGYKEVISFLEGKSSFDETKEVVKMMTRRYAKRQLTWFRKDDRVKWIDIAKEESIESVVKKIKEILLIA
jgi:tRNA dimethylallyltransferase